ncbi:hypothetical protein [Rhizobium laguerreae]|uniref:Uncharacterized protein n=1 Tax=Rhizobium laguerreae TaxID=1076926 RepID=A0A6N9ZK70_9HYPH|nr:hypothetical protein [Rhizobium laguerreae]NEH93138.1 hypothetical protein [Rhizobium laguerreae]
MLETLIVPDHHPLYENPNAIYASDEDTAAVVEMMNKFQASLLVAPEEYFDIFWIQCTHDAISWGGIESGVTVDRGPPLISAREDVAGSHDAPSRAINRSVEDRKIVRTRTVA